jgi:hypothetical protein
VRLLKTEFPMLTNRTRTILAHLMLALGAAGVLATGADHLDEYAANGFSTVPTIGTLFLLNFIAATLIGAGLLLPLRRITHGFGDPARKLLALSGIGLAATSLLGLWISESSGLFGFTDYGLRPTIVVAIAAELNAIVGLTSYLALAHPRVALRPS